MQNYHVRLESEVSKSYRCQRAANSLDINVEKKSIHELKITAEIETPFSVGLILGASGSGKTTLAKKIYGDALSSVKLDENKSILDQIPENLEYEECANLLSGIGLTSVPCWLRPVKTLSNGQRSRALAVLSMLKNEKVCVIDEWTSVVDRTVAKVMSHCIQKYAKKHKKTIVLISCHYDVTEWLDPDWVIDCNEQSFEDRRFLRPEERERKQRLHFEIREIGKRTWAYFSKFHYLSENLPGGKLYIFGLFIEKNQVGFICYANYVPHKDKQTKIIFHANRCVIHPDYQGLGLGIKLFNETAKIMKTKNVRVMAKYSSVPVFKSMKKDKSWKFLETKMQIGTYKSGLGVRSSGYRENVKTFSFEYIG